MILVGIGRLYLSVCKFFALSQNVIIVGIKSDMEGKEQRKHSLYGVREEEKKIKYKMKKDQAYKLWNDSK